MKDVVLPFSDIYDGMSYGESECRFAITTPESAIREYSELWEYSYSDLFQDTSKNFQNLSLQMLNILKMILWQNWKVELTNISDLNDLVNTSCQLCGLQSNSPVFCILVYIKDFFLIYFKSQRLLIMLLMKIYHISVM